MRLSRAAEYPRRVALRLKHACATSIPIARRLVRSSAVCFVLVASAAGAQAQGYSADKPLGAAAQSLPAYLRQAGIDQNLNRALPLRDMFVDEAGTQVPLGRYFGQRPVVLALVYNKCAMLCPQVLHGLGTVVRQSDMQPGREVEVVVASIDPSDTPGDTVEPRGRLLSMLGLPSGAKPAGSDTTNTNDPASHVHFLTAAEPSIEDLAAATGFHYVRVPGPDGRMNQFAHSSVIMIATPDGHMSKYLSGVEYQPRDLRLAVLEASHHHIGSLTDLILLYCCNYTPSQGRYTVAVLRVLGLAAMGSIAMLLLVLYLLTRKPNRLRPA